MFSELSAILVSFVSEGQLMVVIPGFELSFGESKILHRRAAIYLRDRRLVHHASSKAFTTEGALVSFSTIA